MDNNNFEELDSVFNGKTYDEVWTERFRFFKKHGAPDTPEYKKALKEIPKLIGRMRINFNFYAFFFGFIYLLIKGMWKGAITMIAISVVLGVASILFFPDAVIRGIGAALGIIYGMTANYTYYRKEVLGEDDFNIFKGLRWI